MCCEVQYLCVGAVLVPGAGAVLVPGSGAVLVKGAGAVLVPGAGWYRALQLCRVPGSG